MKNPSHTTDCLSWISSDFADYESVFNRLLVLAQSFNSGLAFLLPNII